jgi:DNA-binding IclR family transcriptional regulator
MDFIMIQAISRGVEILRYVSESQRGLRLYELTELMNLKRSTVHNLASSLIGEGLLRKDDESRYQLGELIGELYLKQQSSFLSESIKQEMLRLSALVPGTSLTFAKFGQNEIIEVFRITPDLPYKIVAPQGSVLNPYFTVSGILHFAFLPESKTSLLKMRYPFIPKGQELWLKEARFLSEIENTRERGYALMPLDPPNVFRLGIPVKRNGNFVGTLTWTKHNFTENEKKIMLSEA